MIIVEASHCQTRIFYVIAQIQHLIFLIPCLLCQKVYLESSAKRKTSDDFIMQNMNNIRE